MRVGRHGIVVEIYREQIKRLEARVVTTTRALWRRRRS
jgi:hypothetical protein